MVFQMAIIYRHENHSSFCETAKKNRKVLSVLLIFVRIFRQNVHFVRKPDMPIVTGAWT